MVKEEWEEWKEGKDDDDGDGRKILLMIIRRRKDRRWKGRSRRMKIIRSRI